MEPVCLPEVILTSDSSNSNNNCSIYELATGNLLVSFKEGNSVPRTLSIIDDGYLISALMNKPLLKVWRVCRKAVEDSRFVCSGMVTALAVSNSGIYCIASIEKNIHVWQVNTGDLLAVISRHYQSITCLRFSADDSHFISGGKDAIVITWLLSDAISSRETNETCKPRFFWNDHSAEITDIFIGSLNIYARVATASLDMTCKLYELDTGILLCTICMDLPITAVTMDACEYNLMLGSGNGSIYKVNLYSHLPAELHSNEMPAKSEFKGHKGKVTCLSVSMKGNRLLSGSDDKTCKVWDISSLSCLMTLPHEGPITNAFITMKPFSLMDDEVQPKISISEFKRHFEEQNQTMKLIPAKLQSNKLSLMHVHGPDEYFSRAMLNGSIQSGGGDLRHRDTLREMEKINAQMYAHCLNSLYEEHYSDDNMSDD